MANEREPSLVSEEVPPSTNRHLSHKKIVYLCRIFRCAFAKNGFLFLPIVGESFTLEQQGFTDDRVRQNNATSHHPPPMTHDRSRVFGARLCPGFLGVAQEVREELAVKK